MMNANDASLLGRQELLRRRMFELKRFDSAEYVLAAQQAVRETANSSAKQNDKIVNEEGIFESDGAGHQGVGRQRYMDQVQAAEAYEREHHLDHEHFETHVHSGDCNLGKAAVSPTRNSLRRQHPLQHKIALDPTKQKMHANKLVQIEAGKRALLRRKLAHTRRFDSGDYFRHLRPDEEVLDESPLRISVNVQQTIDSHQSAPSQSLQAATNLGIERGSSSKSSSSSSSSSSSNQMLSNSGALARRFLDKKFSRKRWDSGDYNALRSAPKLSPTGAGLAAGSPPDLDIMSVSSAEGECKIDDSASGYESPASVNGLSGGMHGRPPEVPKLARIHGDSFSSNGDMSAGDSSEKQSLTAMQQHALRSPPMELSKGAAQEHFSHHQRVPRRFDSADYFRGLSPPSQSCPDGPLDEALSPRPWGKKLGKSTLAVRELCVAKAQREKDMDVL